MLSVCGAMTAFFMVMEGVRGGSGGRVTRPALDAKWRCPLFMEDCGGADGITCRCCYSGQGREVVATIGCMCFARIKSMLTERIMHECINKLLGNLDNPEEEEIESLCKLLATVGQLLDTQKARAHMDVYFSRMKELTKNVSSRMQFMLQVMFHVLILATRTNVRFRMSSKCVSVIGLAVTPSPLLRRSHRYTKL